MATRKIRVKIVGNTRALTLALQRAAWACRDAGSAYRAFGFAYRLRHITAVLNAVGDDVGDLSWRWPNCRRGTKSSFLPPSMTTRQLRRAWERKHR